MKFVHLTSSKNISRILKSGLRVGNGRCGKGLYAIPLVHTPHSTFVYDDGRNSCDGRWLLSEHRSNLKMWSWLARARNPRARTAAIVFSLPPRCWPIRVCIEELAPEGGPEFLRRCRRHAHIGLNLQGDLFGNLQGDDDVDDDDWIADFANGDGWLKLIEYKVAGPEAAKAVMNEILMYMGGQWTDWCDLYEFVIPERVPPRYIERIVPLYQTSKKFGARHESRWARTKSTDFGIEL